MGPDAPDADRRRGDDADRAGGAVRRGGRRRTRAGAAPSGGSPACAAISLPGALLLGLSTFQAEFDFGVPQFRMVFQPMLIMLAAGVAAGGGADLARPRGGARRGAVLPRHARPDGRCSSARSWASRRPTSRSTWSRRSWSSSSRCGVEASRCAFGARLRRRARHHRARRRVGLDARVHAAAVARGAAARGADRSASRWPWPRRAWVAGSAPGWPADRDAVAARCSGGRRGGDLRAHGLRPRLDTGRSGLRGTVTGHTATSVRRSARRREGRELVHGHRLAGRRAGRGPAGGVAPGEYRTTQPIPLDGDWKTMIRLHSGNDAERAAGVPAGRPGDPGRRDSRAARVRRASSAPSSSCSSASARPACRVAVGGRVRRRAGDRARVPRRAGVGRAPRLARLRPDLTLPAGRRARARRSAARSPPRRPAARTRAAIATAGRARRTTCPAARPRRSRAPASR